jgi:hypothetical protein
VERRIDRKNDESLYQPRLHSRRIRQLYELKKESGIPMTVLIDRAVSELAESYDNEFDLQDEPIVETTPDETWEDICEYRLLLNELDLKNFEKQ